jgi:hypothetical protein
MEQWSNEKNGCLLTTLHHSTTPILQRHRAGELSVFVVRKIRLDPGCRWISDFDENNPRSGLFL